MNPEMHPHVIVVSDWVIVLAVLVTLAVIAVIAWGFRRR
jgi:hypothetical protein